MKRFWICLLASLIPAPALAQDTPLPAPPSRLWIVAGGASGTLRGHCQDCEEDFPFRHGGAIVANAGYRVNSRMDVGADLFWMQWHNDSGRIRGDGNRRRRAVPAMGVEGLLREGRRRHGVRPQLGPHARTGSG
jgi:hypothetical protein